MPTGSVSSSKSSTKLCWEWRAGFPLLYSSVSDNGGGVGKLLADVSASGSSYVLTSTAAPPGPTSMVDEGRELLREELFVEGRRGDCVASVPDASACHACKNTISK